MDDLEHVMLTKNVKLCRGDIDCYMIGSESKDCVPSPQWVVFYHPYRSKKHYTMYRGGDRSKALAAFLDAPDVKITMGEEKHGV